MTPSHPATHHRHARRPGLRLGSALGLAAALVAPPAARAAEVTVATGDGLALTLDAASGAIDRVLIDGNDVRDFRPYGGVFVRDRQHLTDFSPTAPNLVDNGSFEIDADKDGMPDSWVFYDAYFNGAKLTWDNGGIDGAKSATIHTKAGGVLQQSDIPVTPGTRYLLQAMVKGTSDTQIYVVWKTVDGFFILYESGAGLPASPTWKPLHMLLSPPDNAQLADIVIYTSSDGDATFDRVRLDVASPQAFSAFAAPVTRTATGARQKGTIPALGLDLEAEWIALPDHLELDVVVTDLKGEDRALQAGLMLPVLPRRFWDSAVSSRQITQQNYTSNYAFTYWGGIYNDGPWGSSRSIYPFAAVSLDDASGIALGWDVTRPPQDIELMHSDHIGETFTALVRLGLAAETTRSPRQARFHLVLYRADGPNLFRSALERYYKIAAPAFINRVTTPGAWTWRHPKTIPGFADFGLGVHTSDDDVAADDAEGVLTLGYMGSPDYWMPLGDFTARPTAADAVARLQTNANGSDPQLQADARATLVSALHDSAVQPRLEIYQQTWMPGSGWSAVFGNNPDPEVTDRSGKGWTPRYGQIKAGLDASFTRANGAGARLDGAFFEYLRSQHNDAFNLRRAHFETCDGSLSFDPATLTPGLPEAFAHAEELRTVADEMHGKGLVTMGRDVHYSNFWATAALDLLGEEVDWTSGEDGTEVLSYFRAVAGKKPYLLLLDGDFTKLDVGHSLRRALLEGFFLGPHWDYATSKYYWDTTAYMDRDRPLFKRFVPLLRLEAQAGFEPVTAAAANDPSVRVERWGSRSGGLLLLSAWNGGTTDAAAGVNVDLAALGITPGEVGRVVDLVEAGVRTARITGTTLTIDDSIAPDAARLYHLHLKSASGGRIVLLAAKLASTDVALSWTSNGSALYEVIGAPARNLAGGTVDLTVVTALVKLGDVTTAGNRYWSVE